MLDEDNRHTDNEDWYKGSAFSYAGRMRLKEILHAVYPDQNDFNLVWEAVKQAFLNDSRIQTWAGHRFVRGGLVGVGVYEMSITIEPENEVQPYCAFPAVTTQRQSYRFLGKTAEEAYAGFEFDKW